ncbi:MAG: FtsX-like permease family protein, partial [Bacteroidota bacterium]
RKTLGSSKSGLVYQFLTEATLLVFLSLLLAISTANLVLPYFNDLAAKSMVLPYQSPVFYASLLGFVLLLALCAGAYPAFFISSFTPVSVLKGFDQGKGKGGRIRNGLVIVQFTISVALIVGTLVVFQQLRFIQNKDVGFQKEQILIVDDIDAAAQQTGVLKQRVTQLGQVKQVALSSYLPTPSARSSGTFFPEGSVIQSENALIVGKWKVDYDYVALLDLEIIAGRSFDPQHLTDSTALLLNESAVTMLGVSPEEAIGMRLTDDFRRPDKENMQYATIIGVVKNFHFVSLRNDINALTLAIGKSANKMIVKIKAGDFSETIGQVEKIWQQIAPGQPFHHYFLDDSFQATYEAEQRLGRIFIIFTLLSILIACLGLFGLAAYNAEKRTKEVGIRKVLGASIGQITYTLSIDFLKLVGIAILFALPLSWYAMNKWLEDFSYRIDIPWWIFALAAFLAIVVSILTVSSQSIKAAVVNPIKSLRAE